MKNKILFSLKNKARAEVQNALNRGILKRPIICSRCKKTSKLSIEAHHKDYRKALDVIWLCKKCHFKIHSIYGFQESQKITKNDPHICQTLIKKETRKILQRIANENHRSLSAQIRVILEAYLEKRGL